MNSDVGWSSASGWGVTAGDSHPFGPDRHTAFLREFKARGLDGRTVAVEPREATYEELVSFHAPAYVDLVKERSATGQGCLDAGDTPAFRGVYEAAALVVGATLNATDAIMSRHLQRACSPSPAFITRRAIGLRGLVLHEIAASQSSSCASATASSAWPTWTSMRITEMACSMLSSRIRR